MASLSPLQTLPLHAVEKIVDYFSSNTRLVSGDFCSTGYYDTYFKPQVPLLWVCHSFRAVVYSRFCKRYELVFRKDRNSGKACGLRVPAAKCLDRLSGPFHLVAKDVQISVSPTTIFSGEALTALSQVLPDACLFPSASILVVYYDYERKSDECPAGSSDAGANISAFVRWIRQTMPRLKWLKVSACPSAEEQAESASSHLDSLTTQLVQLASRISLTSCYSRLLRLLNVDSICMLTHLAVDIDLNSENILRLVRQNASTLQYLNFHACPDTDLSTIIRGDDGGYVEYPCLHTLRTMLERGSEVSRQYSFAGAVPFPSLRHLICLEKYPFGGDLVLFRGNAATLDFLHLSLTHELASELLREQIFAPASHPKLQCIMLIPPPAASLSSSAVDPDVLQLMFDMAPGAAVRRISRMTFGEPIPRLLSLLDRHDYLQVLALPDLRLVIWDAITLIRSLPLLSDLHAKAPKLHPIPESLIFHNLIRYVSTNYYPMAKRFRCWHIDYDEEEYVVNSVMPFLLLALACPNFDYIAVFYQFRGLFAERLWMEINTPPFKKLSPRLRRLLLCEPKRM